MIETMRNIYGGGDGWACNADGSIQIKTLATNDTDVEFTNLPAVDTYGYRLYLDPPSGAEAPKQIGALEMTLESNGTYTVTANLTTVTSAQNNTKAQLRIIK